MANVVKWVTAAFYEVSKGEENDEGGELLFGETLEEIYQKQHSERIFTDDEGHSYLLYVLENSEDNFEGDFIRVHKNHGTSGVYEINENELKKLKDENIAQGGAFLYNKSKNILVLQKTFLESNVQSFLRFSKYIENFCGKKYTFSYVIKGNIKDVLERSYIKKIEIGLSKKSLASTPMGDPFALAMRSQGFFGAENFLFTLSVTGEKSLESDVKNLINDSMTPGGIEVSRLRVLLDEEEEMVNLLKDYILSYKEKLTFLENKHTENRGIRIDFLRRAARESSSYF